MSSALAAAKRLKAGEPLAACPQSVILELLQEIELLAATPPANDNRRRRSRKQPTATAAEMDAGRQALLDSTRLRSTKQDLDGPVRAIIEAAKRVKA